MLAYFPRCFWLAHFASVASCDSKLTRASIFCSVWGPRSEKCVRSRAAFRSSEFSYLQLVCRFSTNFGCWQRCPAWAWLLFRRSSFKRNCRRGENWLRDWLLFRNLLKAPNILGSSCYLVLPRTCSMLLNSDFLLWVHTIWGSAFVNGRNSVHSGVLLLTKPNFSKEAFNSLQCQIFCLVSHFNSSKATLCHSLTSGTSCFLNC